MLSMQGLEKGTMGYQAALELAQQIDGCKSLRIRGLQAYSGRSSHVVGFPERADAVYNAEAVLRDGKVDAIYRKTHLPNYGVFDEQRYFRAGSVGGVIELGPHRIGVTICEDIWQPGPTSSEEALAGASLIVNLS